MVMHAKFMKQFKGFKVDVEFKMGNELLVLFGPSGTGKSVTLKMIAGLITPDSGHFKLQDKEFYNHSKGVNAKPQERSIGYVFQNHSLFPHMTVRENILFGAKGLEYNQSQIDADSMIESFNLTGLENKYPHEISGGQGQRAALAMCLIRKPKALLLDEPFSALDTPLRHKMRQSLKDIREKFNIPMILVTHDSEEAKLLGDRILYYDNGTITGPQL
ncbi:MAG: ATP-binding cassette domain-containing protein [Rhizobacter sp.]|nr:ATP-binding cassette domain-containing protein [Bacteriovorax sp.]